MGMSEFHVYRKDPTHPDGRIPVSEQNPGPRNENFACAYDLVQLLEKPNNQDSWGRQAYRWSQQMGLTGTALTYMVPNRFGVPVELYVIPTALAIPQPTINPDYPDGFYRIQPMYPYGPFSSYPTPSTAVGAPIPAQWMLRFQKPHPLLRYDGYSPLTAMRLHIDELEGMDRSRWYKMMRTINPEAVLNFAESEGMQPLPWEEIERIRAEMENEQSGPENAGRLYISTPGATLEQWGTSPKDMDYQGGWDQLVSFILGGGFGISKEACGMLADTSYSQLFASLKQLHLLTLEPDCSDIGADLTKHLAPFFGDDLVVEVRVKRIDDPDILDKKISTMITGKLGTVNEARRLLGLPITDEKWGSERLGAEPQQGPQMPGDATNQAMGEPPASQQAADKVGAEGGFGMQEPQDEAEAARPDLGGMNTGSLGPRMKSLLRNKYRKSASMVLSNGRH
jgi:phage portal protein BeeE